MGVGRRIKGEGPLDASYMLIGEHPSRDDAKSGRPFTERGKVGREISRLFDGIRLPAKDQVYATCFVKEWCGDDGDYTQADFDRDEPELCEEIRRVQPTLIIALSRPVVRWFLGDVDLEETHALQWYLPIDSPRRALFIDPGSVVIHAGYNPAAGFRSAELSTAVAYDFAQLEAYLDGKLTPKILYDDAHPSPVYEEIRDVETIDQVMAEGGLISSDTEGYPHDPWSAQLTTHAGHAYIIRYRYKDLIARFVEWVNACPTLYTFIFHNSLHDLSVYRAFGIDVRKIQFHDTMIMAYNLQLEPQGLKPLCVRHCGMAMQSFDDVMGDASYRLAIDWLLSTQECEDAAHAQHCQEEFTRLTTTPYTDAKGRVKPGRKIRTLPKLPKSQLHKAIERCLRSKEPRKLWDNQDLDRHVEATPQYGPMWEATLDHVPLAQAVQYAGRDSDGTHRLFPVLAERLAASDMWEVYQADLRTVPLIDRMQYIGIRPDLNHFRSLSVDLGYELVEIQTRLVSQLLAFGIDSDQAWTFNANSTYQVGEILYQKFQLPQLKMTSGGDPSTNDKILEALEKDAHIDKPIRDFIATIREYREVYKLKHTFVDQIPSFVNRWPFDGRIHATFRITRVVSGRLAASDPNLLALPKHGKFAKRFRQGFTASNNNVIGSWDLSQIELRVLAHLSQDPVLLHAFRSGEDLHAKLAQRIFGVAPKDQDGSKHRLPAKCFHPDTEVLTRTGWRKITHIDTTTEIMQAWPLEEGRVLLEWATPLDVHTEARHEDLVHLKNEGMDLRVTSDHLMLGWGSTNKPFLTWPTEFSSRVRVWANAGELMGSPAGKQPDETTLRLAVACQADGSITPNGAVRWGFTKERKITRLRSLLTDRHIVFSESITAQGVTTFYVSRGYATKFTRLLDEDKTLPWRWLSLPRQLRETVLDEVQYWDSHVADNWTHIAYSSVPQKNRDVLQALAAVTGRKARDDGHATLSIKDHATTRGENLTTTLEPFDGSVACLSVPSGFVLVRDRGVVVVCKQSINFGIPMGMTEVGLCVELKKNGLDVTEDDAKRWLNETMQLYGKVPEYQQNKIAEARRNGFVTDLAGRRRYVGGIRSSDNATRSEAERFAFSTPIQAGAQEVAKCAMDWAWQNVFIPYQDTGKFCEPLIWIHDDFVPEAEIDILEEMDQKMVYAMTQTFKGLSVPIETSGDYGFNWGSQVPIRCGKCKGFNKEMRPESKKDKPSSCQHCGEEMKG